MNSKNQFTEERASNDEEISTSAYYPRTNGPNPAALGRFEIYEPSQKPRSTNKDSVDMPANDMPNQTLAQFSEPQHFIVESRSDDVSRYMRESRRIPYYSHTADINVRNGDIHDNDINDYNNVNSNGYLTHNYGNNQNLQYDDNYGYESGGWNRYSNLSVNNNNVPLEIRQPLFRDNMVYGMYPVEIAEERSVFSPYGEAQSGRSVYSNNSSNLYFSSTAPSFGQRRSDMLSSDAAVYSTASTSAISHSLSVSQGLTSSGSSMQADTGSSQSADQINHNTRVLRVLSNGNKQEMPGTPISIDNHKQHLSDTSINSGDVQQIPSLYSMHSLNSERESMLPSNVPVVSPDTDELDKSYMMGSSDDHQYTITQSNVRRGGGRKKYGKTSDVSTQLLTINVSNLINDNRTTLMIRNIPNSFTQEVLLKIVNGYIPNQFDFFYLPIDFHTQCNLGYCYINVVSLHTVQSLYVNFHNKHWPNTPSQKTCQICYARIQGMDQMLEHSKDWAVMHLPEQFRPLFYKSVIQIVDGKQICVMQRITPDVEMKMR